MDYQININGLQICYEDVGTGQVILLLHGWGASKAAFQPVIKGLQNRYRLIAMDWPGFGSSKEPETPWTVSDYQVVFEKFIEALDLQAITVIAHSFGGRVMIKWAAGKPQRLAKLILVDSAGIRPKRTLAWYIKVYTYKAGKQLMKVPGLKAVLAPLVQQRQSKAGSEDYRQASPLMKQTMIRVINEDLQTYLPRIIVPTLLVWGESDTATPLADGQLMEKLIPNAGLAVLRPAGHFSYLDQLQQFLRVVEYFMEH